MKSRQNQFDKQLDGHIKAQRQDAITFLETDYLYNQLQLLGANSDGRNFLGASLVVGYVAFTAALWAKMDATQRTKAMFQEDNNAQHSFHLAAALGNEGFLTAFMNQDAEDKKKQGYWLAPDNKGDTPLMVAAKHGHAHIIRAFLGRMKNGEEVINTLNLKQDRLLHVVLTQPNLAHDLDLISDLIGLGGGLNLANKKLETPLTYISQWSHDLQVALVDKLSKKSINDFLLNYYSYAKEHLSDPLVVANYLALTKKYHKKASFLGEIDFGRPAVPSMHFYEQNQRTYFELDTLHWAVIKSGNPDNERLNRWKVIGGAVDAQPVTQFLYGKDQPLLDRSNPLLKLNDLIAATKDFKRELNAREDVRHISYRRQCNTVSASMLLLLGLGLLGEVAFLSSKLAHYDKMHANQCGDYHSGPICKAIDKKSSSYFTGTIISGIIVVPLAVTCIVYAFCGFANCLPCTPRELQIESDEWQRLISDLADVVLSPLQNLKTTRNAQASSSSQQTSLPTSRAVIARLEAVPASLNVDSLPLTQMNVLLTTFISDLKQLRRDSIYTGNMAFLFTEPSDVEVAMPAASSSMSIN